MKLPERSFKASLLRPAFTGAAWYIGALGSVAALKDYADPLAAFVVWGHLHPAYLVLIGGAAAIGNVLVVDGEYQKRQAELDAIRRGKLRKKGSGR